MTEERPKFVPGAVLAHVSVRVAVPLLGGAIAGMVADGLGGTSPLYVLIGLAAGTVVSVLWLRAYVVASLSDLRRDTGRVPGDGAEKDERTRAGGT